MEKGEEIAYIFKIILLGDSGVGKSNILYRFSKDEFSHEMKPTISMEFFSKIIKIGGKKVKLNIWDTAGQEKFKAVSKQYYKGACGILVVYDITRRQSFENLPK